MTPPPPALQDFARRLLIVEANGRTEADRLADAAARCCQALRNRLTPLLSVSGVDALMERALALSARTIPGLARFEVLAGEPCRAEALRRIVDTRSDAEAAEVLATILATFIWLLIIFIGENLGLRKIREIWPEVPYAPPPTPEKTE